MIRSNTLSDYWLPYQTPRQTIDSHTKHHDQIQQPVGLLTPIPNIMIRSNSLSDYWLPSIPNIMIRSNTPSDHWLPYQTSWSHPTARQTTDSLPYQTSWSDPTACQTTDSHTKHHDQIQHPVRLLTPSHTKHHDQIQHPVRLLTPIPNIMITSNTPSDYWLPYQTSWSHPTACQTTDSHTKHHDHIQQPVRPLTPSHTKHHDHIQQPVRLLTPSHTKHHDHWLPYQTSWSDPTPCQTTDSHTKHVFPCCHRLPGHLSHVILGNMRIRLPGYNRGILLMKSSRSHKHFLFYTWR